jgi:hypothetical protein
MTESHKATPLQQAASNTVKSGKSDPRVFKTPSYERNALDTSKYGVGGEIGSRKAEVAARRTSLKGSISSNLKYNPAGRKGVPYRDVGADVASMRARKLPDGTLAGS